MGRWAKMLGCRTLGCGAPGCAERRVSVVLRPGDAVLAPAQPAVPVAHEETAEGLVIPVAEQERAPDLEVLILDLGRVLQHRHCDLAARVPDLRQVPGVAK